VLAALLVVAASLSRSGNESGNFAWTVDGRTYVSGGLTRQDLLDIAEGRRSSPSLREDLLIIAGRPRPDRDPSAMLRVGWYDPKRGNRSRVEVGRGWPFKWWRTYEYETLTPDPLRQVRAPAPSRKTGWTGRSWIVFWTLPADPVSGAQKNVWIYPGAVLLSGWTVVAFVGACLAFIRLLERRRRRRMRRTARVFLLLGACAVGMICVALIRAEVENPRGSGWTTNNYISSVDTPLTLADLRGMPSGTHADREVARIILSSMATPDDPSLVLGTGFDDQAKSTYESRHFGRPWPWLFWMVVHKSPIQQPPQSGEGLRARIARQRLEFSRNFGAWPGRTSSFSIELQAVAIVATAATAVYLLVWGPSRLLLSRRRRRRSRHGECLACGYPLDVTAPSVVP
jgi:hypothetical protein